MKIDLDRTVVMEKDGWPGNIGDSCAETSRLWILSPAYRPMLNLDAFVTDRGFVRHPSAPASAPGSGDNWREPDFSVDQALPLVLAKGIRAKWWCIPGTRTIVSPGLWAAVRGHWRIFALTLVAQTLIFKIPWRWSDSKKWFERSSDSSADFLNYFVGFMFLRNMGIEWPGRFIDWRTPVKILDYYQSEPNSEWFVEQYGIFRLKNPET